MLSEFLEKHNINQDFEVTAQKWFIPLAEQILMHQSGAKSPYFVGVNGCQGSGKSTLSDFLKDYLTITHNLKVVVMSLDDFYLDQTVRSTLAQTIHPLLATRGVPGTHDTQMIQHVLSCLAECRHPVLVPQFDKSIDNPKPKSEWLNVPEPVDVVLFEGWCWGVPAQECDSVVAPINALEQELDKDGAWREFVNTQLRLYYQPLYKRMDFWVMLKAPSFENVFKWRLEQEQKLKQRVGPDAPGVMDEQQVSRFIQHYQRLTEHGLKVLPMLCNQVFELDEHRKISSVQTREFHGL